MGPLGLFKRNISHAKIIARLWPMLITKLSGKFSLIHTVEYFGFLEATKYNSGVQMVTTRITWNGNKHIKQNICIKEANTCGLDKKC